MAAVKSQTQKKTISGVCLEYEPDECIFNVAGKGKCCERTAPNSDYCPESVAS
jgi:hypothetical protein